jgi:hypothetical protein
MKKPSSSPKANLLRLTAVLLVCAGLFVSALAAQPVSTAPAPSTQEINAFYFGNSLTGSTMPKWHEELGKSAGKNWPTWAWLGAGWQLQMHREELTAGKDIFSTASKGDLTIEDEVVKNAPFNAKNFYGKKWDVITLQLFGGHVSMETDSMYGKKLSYKKDVGDLGAATDIMKIYLSRNPAGKVFVYQVWPPMDPGKIPPADQLPEWAKGKEKLRTAEFPNREAFDYPAKWLQKYEPTDKPWIGNVNRTQDFSYQVFKGLEERFPELAKENRLRMIPAGDLFLEIDKLAKEGGILGVKDVRDFYTDVQHLRFGLPRYTVAALFYASLFGEKPDALDWKLFNDREKYGEDTYHDGGELLPITEENVKVIHDLIWKILQEHPYSGMKAK